MMPDLSATPRLAPGVRLSDSDHHGRVLLMPERALRLNNSSFEILSLCDGERSVRQIAAKLHAAHPAAELERIINDTIDYLASLHDERAIDF
jgi:pyrroloquinoline quinone biosynthesis protein D